MKKLLTFVVFVLAISFGSAQEFRFKTSSVSVLQKKRANEWGKWSTPKPTEIIATLNFDKEKIIIYSAEVQYYSIIEHLGTERTEVDVITSYLCKNIEGIVVKISFFIRKDQKNKTQLYVYHENFAFCYDITEVTE